MSFCARAFFVLVPLLTALDPAAAHAAESRDFAGLVDIGGDRKIYLECRGAGSPTVVLISGKGNGATDWSEVLDPADPARQAPFDSVGAGAGGLFESESAVFPAVSRFTRVCAYDRPGTRIEGANTSTPVAQPHRVDQDVDDLRKLLAVAREPGPYVLVPHSYGGLIALLYARLHPEDVAGLVMVDAASNLIGHEASALELAEWDASHQASYRAAPEAVEILDAIGRVEAAPVLPERPAVVLSADKPWQSAAPDAHGKTSGGMITFAEWLAAQDLLAASLHATHLAKTHSGHNTYLYDPDLVVDAIRKVVNEVRRVQDSTPTAGDASTLSIDQDSRADLEKSLDKSFAESGLPGVTIGLWIPGKVSWIASRGVADLKTSRPMTADLQAPIGSITKTFTTTIALQLVGDDKLRLDDTIDRWRPQVPDASAITVKMLLNHSSGLADISQLQLDLHCADPNKSVSPDELIAKGAALPRAAFPPGKGYLYSSWNTIVLGRILEQITGEKFETLMRERLLEPLALRRTKLDTDGKLDPPFSHGYTDFCPNLPARTDTSEWPQFSFAAGALASTLSDLHM
jgi:CubicO group peptidase (beta-lactamase class C family)